MSVRIPSGLYSQGQATLDTGDFTKNVIKDIAAKKAAKEAVIKKADAIAKTINTAGVREQDLVNPADPTEPRLDAEIKNWYDKSKKGDVDLVEYNNILHKIDQSKQRAKFQVDLGKAAIDHKYDPDDDDIHVNSLIDKSIYDKTSLKADGTEYGWLDLPANIPQFDPAKQTTFFNVVKGKSKPTYQEDQARVDNVTGDIFIPMAYGDSELKSQAEIAGHLIDGSMEAKKYYNKMFEKDAQGVRTPTLKKEYEDLNESYKSIYGANEVIDTPEKAAKADAIRRGRAETQEVKVTDPNYANQLKRKLKQTVGGGSRGGGGGAAPVINDVWTPVNDAVNADIAAGNTGGTVLTNLNIPITTRNGIVELVKGQMMPAMAQYLKPESIIIKKENGKLQIYDDKGTSYGEYEKTATNTKAGVGTSSKNATIKAGGGTQTKAAQPKLSSYPAATQAKINKFMQANGLSEADAISALIKAGKI